MYGSADDEDPKIVCVCNATYCDEIISVKQLERNEAVVFISTQSGKRFEKSSSKFSKSSNSRNGPIKIKINSSKRYQKILGFGGAFTDSAGINVNRLTLRTQTNFLESYFGAKGIAYTVGRVSIASCDFSTHEYSYADIDQDFNLVHFNLTVEDYKYKIPYIKEAQKLSNGQLIVFGSPWSAPGWMKSNGRMKGGGTLKGKIGGQYRYHFVLSNMEQIFYSVVYFLLFDDGHRFLEEYYKNGIKIWGITLQNEPGSGLDKEWRWQTMHMSSEMQSLFVRDLLGPQIRKHSKFSQTKIIIHDDQRCDLSKAADEILESNATDKYVDGLAVHWYFDRDERYPPEILTTTHTKHPNKFILMTEACNGFPPVSTGPSIGNWSRGEAYARDIIENLSHWVTGWVDWNMALDEDGGPNWALNHVDSPILVNNTKDEFYKQPMYYALGHFSKFVLPNSVRIDSTIEKTDSKSQFDVIAFETPQNRRVLVINNRESVKYDIEIEDTTAIGKTLKINSEPHSILTILYDKDIQ